MKLFFLKWIKQKHLLKVDLKKYKPKKHERLIIILDSELLLTGNAII